MRLIDFLGRQVRELLATAPFSGWSFARTVENDLPDPEIRYEFDSRQFEVLCDENENVKTIFLHAGAEPSVTVVPFSMTREEALEHFGVPSASGTPIRHPVLGEKGAWDRFASAAGTVHLEYSLDRDQIERITLMRSDSVPDGDVHPMVKS